MKRTMQCAMQQQRGLGLATALFVITVMALLAVLITQLVRSGAQSTAEQLNLVRAFFAAQSGVEYGLNRAWPPDAAPGACPAVHNDSLTFPVVQLTVDGLAQCTMEVTCATLIVDSKTYYTITSTGTCGEVSRTVQVRAQ
jgi:MSHA biogenesis protein MshP